MPKPNYAFAKRQRDLAKKQKKEEKLKKKVKPEDAVSATDAAPGPASEKAEP